MSTEELITYEQIENQLSDWEQYINSNDFAILKEFVYNTANNIPFNKLLIFYGTGGNGKTKLIHELFSLIGKENCMQSSVVYNTQEENGINTLICNENPYTKKLIVYNEYNSEKDICDVIIKNILTRTEMYSRQLYQKAECHYPNANQILVTNNIKELKKEILDYSNVIHFTHVFK